MLPAPKDVRERLSILLERYEQVQRQRVAEIVAYATTRRCRHGHISAYFGGRVIDRCVSCDNCVKLPGAKPEAHLPDETAQLQVILEAAEHGWGQHNLILILRGGAEAPQAAHHQPWFGALAYRSQAALERMIETLVAAGLLETKKLEHGGVMVKTTPTGQRAVGDHSMLRLLAAGLVSDTPLTEGREGERRSGPDEAAATEAVDGELLGRLQAWRLGKACELGVPAFMVAHNSLLHNIAAACPHTPEELRAVKGIGPRKFEQYGSELLALVQAEPEKGQG